MSTEVVTNPLRVIHNAVASVLESSAAFQTTFGTGSRFRYFFFEDISDFSAIQPGDTPFAYVVLNKVNVTGHGTSSSTLVTMEYNVTVVAATYESLMDAIWALSMAIVAFQHDTKTPTLNMAFQAGMGSGDVSFNHALLKSSLCTLTVSAAVRTEQAMG